MLLPEVRLPPSRTDAPADRKANLQASQRVIVMRKSQEVLMLRLIAFLAVGAVPVILSAQTPGATAEPRFEAATLRINKSGDPRAQISAVPENGRLTVTNSRVN